MIKWIRKNHTKAIAIFAGIFVVVNAALFFMSVSHAPVPVIPRVEKIPFTTTVTGITTNTNKTPLIINGLEYNSTDITMFKTLSNRNRSMNSMVHMSIGNFLAGAYAEFNVTIQNTGTETLLLNTNQNNVSVVNYLINPDGSYKGTAGAKNGNVTFPMADFGYITNSEFQSALNGYTSWFNSFGQNTTSPYNYNQVSPVPHELKPGQSFSYLLFIGLGTNAPYPISGELFSISIPLIPAK